MNPSDVVATSAALAVVARNSKQELPSISAIYGGIARRIASSDTNVTLTAGLAAGCVSRTATAPLDRLKTLAQEGRVGADRHHPSEIARMRFLARHIFQEGGVASFWRGNGANCLKAGPEYAIALTARQWFAQRLCENPAKPSKTDNFVLGAAGGLTAQLMLYPLEVTKTRMAVAHRTEYRGIADCIGQSLRRGGVADLYRGLGANLAGVVPHRSIEMGLFFSGEEALRRWYGEDRTPIALVSCVGFGASVVSQIATYPLNLARTRLQTQGVNGRPSEYTSLLQCLASVVRADGVRGLFVGLAPNMLKAAPASTIMYTSFHQTKQHLAAWRDVK